MQVLYTKIVIAASSLKNADRFREPHPVLPNFAVALLESHSKDTQSLCIYALSTRLAQSSVTNALDAPGRIISRNPEDNSPGHNISNFFISSRLTHLQTIPNLDGSFSGFNVSTWKQRASPRSRLDLRAHLEHGK